MYFSSIFPYVVLFCFLVRGLMLNGALEGITYMFYPKVCANNVLMRIQKKLWIFDWRTCWSFHTRKAGNLGRHSGVAAGGNPGVLCFRPWLRVCYCLLIIQSQEQQLPPRCLHCLWNKLPHISAGYSRRVFCARLPCQGESHRMFSHVCFHHYVIQVTSI